jgi:phosphotriesterase-related protein
MLKAPSYPFRGARNMGIIRTLNGDISANQLGVTYSHDHIYCIPPYWAERQDDDLLLDDPQASERELSDFRRAGGNAIYDATAPDYGRQAAAVAAMAQRQQLHIIATAGFNKGFLWSSKRPGSAQTFAEWIAHSDVDELVEHVCREVTEGIEGTEHRAGVVKCGTGYNAISPLEQKTMEVIVRAQQRTGRRCTAIRKWGRWDSSRRSSSKMGAGSLPLMFCSYGS